MARSSRKPPIIDPAQGSLFPVEPALPPGFALFPDLIAPAEEAALLAWARGLRYEPFVLHGRPSRRETAVFGHDYDPEARSLSGAPPLPAELGSLRDRCAARAGLSPGPLIQAVVTRYPPGAPIGWHADYPVFGPAVLGVSLGAACRFKLRPRARPEDVRTLLLPPRSLYVLAGAARAAWQHAIPPVSQERYSITYRSLRAPAPRLGRVVSGGQTGADRAALDAALEAGVPCGGFCPSGRWAEDGRVRDRYPLRETPSADPAERTRWNVRDSDGTLVLARGPLRGGTALAAETATALGRPLLVLDPSAPDALARARAWLAAHAIAALNVAGPRESEDPGLYEAALPLLRALLAPAPET